MNKYKLFKGYLDPESDKSVLKDVRGCSRTESLFLETIQYSIKDKYKPLYSLRDYEHKGFPSAYQIYMNSVDENEAAMKLVGTLSHWRKLINLKWFQNGRANTGFEGINQWRKDMAARDSTEAKRVLLSQCSTDNVAAARALKKQADDDSKKIKVIKPKQQGGEDQDVVDFLEKLENRSD